LTDVTWSFLSALKRINEQVLADSHNMYKLKLCKPATPDFLRTKAQADTVPQATVQIAVQLRFAFALGRWI